MRHFCLPDLGEGLHDAEIVEWHAREGEDVAVDQLLVTVETAKAVVEVPSPVAGRILRCFGQPGDVVRVGAPLVEFAGGDAGTVVGSLAGANTATPAQDRFHARDVTTEAGAAVLALAARLGVDLAGLSGTGPGGRLRAQDVEEAALRQRGAGGAQAAPRGEALRGMRRSMAIAMEAAGRSVVPVSIFEDADISHWPKDADVTVRLAQGIAAACAAEPQLNAWYDGHARRLELCPQVHLGIAIDTPEGLIAPVLRDVGGRDADSLRQGLDTLRANARARRTAPEDLRGASITLSNFGVFAGRYATPVVVVPTVCIIAAGRVCEGVRVVDGAPAVRRLLPLSITADHRAVTGGELARFLTALLASLARL